VVRNDLRARDGREVMDLLRQQTIEHLRSVLSDVDRLLLDWLLEGYESPVEIRETTHVYYSGGPGPSMQNAAVLRKRISAAVRAMQRRSGRPHLIQ
jgi:hypothetical protein